jgi:hypothetical protein
MPKTLRDVMLFGPTSARQAAAEAYAQAVLDAVQALRERSGEAWAGKADHSDP